MWLPAEVLRSPVSAVREAAVAGLPGAWNPHLRAIPLLLGAAKAASRTAAAAEHRRDMGMQGAGYWQWANQADAAALVLLQVLPMLPWPVVALAAAADGASTSAAAADGASTSTAAAAPAAAVAAGASGAVADAPGRECLLDFLPQLLTASVVFQRSRLPDPPRPNCTALLCDCLAAVAAEPAVGTAAQRQACASLLQLLLSPAVAWELRQAFLGGGSEGSLQLARHAFQAALRVLPVATELARPATEEAAELARLAGSCAYLAVNALASLVQRAWTPAGALVATPGSGGAGGSLAGARVAATLLTRHSNW